MSDKVKINIDAAPVKVLIRPKKIVANVKSAQGGKGNNGNDGLSAYEIALSNGFVGTEQEWLDTLQGQNGLDGISAYQVAVNNGFVGTESDWLNSLHGQDADEALVTQVIDNYSDLSVDTPSPLPSEVITKQNGFWKRWNFTNFINYLKTLFPAFNNANNSMAGNFEVLGQLTAPNQTANTPQSIINKKLLASQFLFHNCYKFAPSGAWSNVSVSPTSGSGSSSIDANNLLRLDGAGTASAGAITIRHLGAPVIGVVDPVRPTFATSFYAPILLKIRVYHTYLNQYDRDNQSWCFCFGGLLIEPTSDISTLMPSSPGNANVGYVALWCDRGAVKLVTQIGTGAKVVSSTLETLSAVGYFDRQYSILIKSGTAYLYSDTTLLGSVTGAPITGVASGGSGAFHINHTSFTAAPSQQRRLVISRIDCFWGSPANI